jgi:hypothetical protein
MSLSVKNPKMLALASLWWYSCVMNYASMIICEIICHPHREAV